MRSFLRLAAPVVFAAGAAATLPDWVRHAESGGTIEQILFAERELPAGPVPVRRAPAETRPLLDEAIASEDGRADLYALRAREAERALDYVSAERDWRA